MKSITAIAASAAMLAGCATSLEMPVLPENYTTTTGDYDQQYVDEVTFKYPAPETASFTDRVARCGVSNLSIDSFVAKDTSRSWVGPATGNYYEAGNRSTVEGSEVLKYISDSENIVVLSGRENYGQASGWQAALADSALFENELDFDVEAALKEEKYVLTFKKIERASHSTGAIENRGFMPVGIWKGSRADEIVPVIDDVAERLNDCIQS
ncbi:hypothetical protein [Henriciella aquimarina]|uniref:hypothetical protein n=1 Tax=Henriciella aquimarina TaxID=545261 RepID=UPI0009FF462A|nr:hypothetical protein [Henriciella aquimarina]